MFRVGQVPTPTELIKNLRKVAHHIEQYPQALLVTQHSGKHLVVMDAELFDQMTERASRGTVEAPQDTALNYQLKADC